MSDSELEAKAKVLERNNEHLSSLLDARQNELFEAESEIARLREREAQQKEVTQKWYDEAHDKRRQVARLEEALREIADWPVEKEEAPYARSMAKELAGIARRALGEE